MRKQLEGVKVGDTIQVFETYGKNFHLYVVERVTDTRAVCEKASFMIESGLQIGTRSGGRWPTSKSGSLVPDAEVKKVRHEMKIKARIRNAQAYIQRVIINESNLEVAENLLKASK